jgi:hypothetical protein
MNGEKLWTNGEFRSRNLAKIKRNAARIYPGFSVFISLTHESVLLNP